MDQKKREPENVTYLSVPLPFLPPLTPTPLPAPPPALPPLDPLPLLGAAAGAALPT